MVLKGREELSMTLVFFFFTVFLSCSLFFNGLFGCREGWATCPSGFFLRGFHRGTSDELKSIQWATCCKPALHPYWYPDCYDQDVDQGDLRQCTRDDFLLVGLYREKGEQLSSVKKFRCCKMLEGKQLQNYKN